MPTRYWHSTQCVLGTAATPKSCGSHPIRFAPVSTRVVRQLVAPRCNAVVKFQRCRSPLRIITVSIVILICNVLWDALGSHHGLALMIPVELIAYVYYWRTKFCKSATAAEKNHKLLCLSFFCLWTAVAATIVAEQFAVSASVEVTVTVKKCWTSAGGIASF